MQHEPLDDEQVTPMLKLLRNWDHQIARDSQGYLRLQQRRGTYLFKPVALIKKAEDHLLILGHGTEYGDIVLRFHSNGDCDVTEGNHVAKNTN